jgi:hypothetical protein
LKKRKSGKMMYKTNSSSVAAGKGNISAFDTSHCLTSHNRSRRLGSAT